MYIQISVRPLILENQKNPLFKTLKIVPNNEILKKNLRHSDWLKRYIHISYYYRNIAEISL